MEHGHIFIRIISTFIHKYMNYNYLVQCFYVFVLVKFGVHY